MSRNVMSEKWWKISKEEEYKKNNKLKPSDVEIVQEWLKKQPHLPPLNDNQIIMFIRACDYSLEKTKDTIDLNYTSRTTSTEHFQHRDLDSEGIKVALDFVKLGFLPERQNGDIVVYSGMNPVDVSKFFFEDFLKLSYMLYDMSHLEYGSAEGYQYIMDMNNFTLNLVFRISISSMIKSLKFWQFCSTYKIKGIHVINAGPAFEKLFQIVSPVFTPEVSKMIFVHSNYESLKKVLDDKCIPSDYGGTGPSANELTKKAQEDLKKYKKWFFEEEKQRVNEKKRLSPLSNELGIQGSFRKLDLD